MDWRILQGNCADVLAEYEGQADLIVTSPPYDDLREYGGHRFDFDRVKMPIVRALKPGGVLVWVVADATVDGSETGTSFRQALAFMDAGLRLHDTMIYRKSFPGSWTPNRYQQDFEYMFVLSNGKPNTFHALKDRANKTAGKTKRRASGMGKKPNADLENRAVNLRTAPFGLRSGVWDYMTGLHHSAPGFPDAHQHPALFPYALAADHISSWSNLGDLVIDPMCGSGTVVHAAVTLGRRAVGIDIHKPYCEIARLRMAQQVLV